MTDNSIFLGKIKVEPEDDPFDIAEYAYLQYDKKELIDAISDPDISKYEIEHLVEKLQNSEPSFWMFIFKEIISHYQLGILKNFLSNEPTKENVEEIIELLMTLKYDLPEIQSEELMPIEHEQTKNYFEKFNIKSTLLNFAIQIGGQQVYLKIRKLIVGEIE